MMIIKLYEISNNNKTTCNTMYTQVYRVLQEQEWMEHSSITRKLYHKSLSAGHGVWKVHKWYTAFIHKGMNTERKRNPWTAGWQEFQPVGIQWDISDILTRYECYDGQSTINLTTLVRGQVIIYNQVAKVCGNAGEQAQWPQWEWDPDSALAGSQDCS